MKKFLLSSLLFLPSLAFADTTPGFYVQGEAGVSGAEGILFIGPAARFSAGYLLAADNNLSYGVESGLGYNKNKFIFNIFGDTPGYTAVNLDLLGVLKYTFDSGFNLFAKAGGAYSYITTFIDNDNGTTKVGTSAGQFFPAVALGMGYQFNQNIEMDLTASTLFMKGGTGDKGQLQTYNNNLMLGWTYHFA